MATNKKPNDKTQSEPAPKAASTEATTNQALALTAETAAILESVLPGSSESVEVVQPNAVTASTAPASESPPPTVERILEGPVESAVAKVFESSPAKESRPCHVR